MHEENVRSGEQIANFRPRHPRHYANGLGCNRDRTRTKALHLDAAAHKNELNPGRSILDNFRCPKHRLQSLSGTHVSSKDDIESSFEREGRKIAVTSGPHLRLVRPVVNYLDLGLRNSLPTEHAFETRRYHYDPIGPGIDPMAQPVDNPQREAVGDHSRSDECARPHVVYRVNKRDAADRRDDGCGKADGHGWMIDVHDVRAPLGDEAIDR